MTRLSKTALLASGLTAALLMSAPLANAATLSYGNRAYDSHSQTMQRDQHSGDRNKARTDTRNSNDRYAHDNQYRRDAHKGRYRHGPRYAENGRRIFFLRYDRARYGDQYHRPPVRTEYTGRAPHRDMRWQAGEWRWHNNHWIWVAGIWLLAAQMSHH